MNTLDSTFETEIKILSELDITEALIKISENQERLMARLKALTEEVERLKYKVLERG
jgi:hypothetical protein